MDGCEINPDDDDDDNDDASVKISDFCGSRYITLPREIVMFHRVLCSALLHPPQFRERGNCRGRGEEGREEHSRQGGGRGARGFMAIGDWRSDRKIAVCRYLRNRLLIGVKKSEGENRQSVCIRPPLSELVLN